MKKNLIRLAAVAALTMASAPVFADEIPAVNATRTFKSGEDAWNKTCARCHTTIDDKHDQAVGPYLGDLQHDQETIKYFVRNGFLAMPAFREAQLDNATLDELADYIVNEVQKGAAK